MDKENSVLEAELFRHFGYNAFRTGQKEIIEDILSGKDVFGILPTGTGKSVCYQLPAKLLNGITIVVTPLVSLMMDQVKELNAIHYRGAAAINGFVQPQERKQIYRNLASYRLIYVSPELLQRPELLAALRKVKIALFVIDEAHCISQWGHEFRPDYLKLGETLSILGNPQLLALSATAAPAVRQDIYRVLNSPHMKEHIYPMDRENIALGVVETQNEEEKLQIILEWLKKDYGPALIYFSSRNTAEEIAQKLLLRLPDKRIAFYHGGMDQMDRVLVQQQFMNGQLDIICCTSAFGMGINKKDIRLVMHYHLPTSLEAYIQEIGRAGRDGKQSISLLLYSESDVYLSKNLIQNELPDQRMLEAAFRILQGLWQSENREVGTGPEYQNLFQLNEVQWRFLYYQFEKHGMIRGNQICYDKERWSGAFQSITMYLQDRMQHKEEKLKEIFSWVKETECLRTSLYSHFQDSCRIPEENCCIRCGLNESALYSEGKNVQPQAEGDWQEKLRQILFAGLDLE